MLSKINTACSDGYLRRGAQKRTSFKINLCQYRTINIDRCAGSVSAPQLTFAEAVHQTPTANLPKQLPSSQLHAQIACSCSLGPSSASIARPAANKQRTMPRFLELSRIELSGYMLSNKETSPYHHYLVRTFTYLSRCCARHTEVQKWLNTSAGSEADRGRCFQGGASYSDEPPSEVCVPVSEEPFSLAPGAWRLVVAVVVAIGGFRN